MNLSHFVYNFIGVVEFQLTFSRLSLFPVKRVGCSENNLEKHKRDCTASEEREPIMGVWGRVQGQSPCSVGQGGAKPPEAETNSALLNFKEHLRVCYCLL